MTARLQTTIQPVADEVAGQEVKDRHDGKGRNSRNDPEAFPSLDKLFLFLLLVYLLHPFPAA